MKYGGEKHALHLKQTLKENYKVTTEYDGTRYIGITLDWDTRCRQVHFSLPEYTDKSLKQFNHTKNKNKTSHTQAQLSYIGPKKQYATQPSSALVLDKKAKKFIQQVCGKKLFLEIAVDSTLLCPISVIVSQSANSNEETMRQTHQLLDCIATQ